MTAGRDQHGPREGWGRGFHMKGGVARRLAWVFTNFDLTYVQRERQYFQSSRSLLVHYVKK